MRKIQWQGIRFVVLLIILTMISACASTIPINTQTELINKINEKQDVSLKFIVIDQRNDLFKNKKYVSDKSIGVRLATADKCFDKPLNVVLENMLKKRYGQRNDGTTVEIKLMAFYSEIRPVMFSTTEFSATISSEISIFNKDNKKIFNRTYDRDVREKRMPASDTQENIASVLIKAFNRFADDLEGDINLLRATKLL